MNILALIPARMGSSRFPGKPMAKIINKPMIGHVYERVIQCNLLTKVAVATCDNEIADYINSIGPYINESLVDMGWDLKNQNVKITSMWSIINRNDATNARHIHSNNYISAAYYVKAPENCGNIVFHDPRSEPVYFHPKVENPNNLNTNIVSIKPEEGLLVLFPSYLHHSVDVNRSNEDRIVISFNINLS